jgi:L-ascorbate metabolism protein UlaG (beta-lactamase superfamily)
MLWGPAPAARVSSRPVLSGLRYASARHAGRAPAGGAGFALQDAGGQAVFVDPYLSDLCGRLHGFRRLTPSPLLVTEAQPAAVGVVVELGGARVYHAGDTAYRADFLPAVRGLRPDVAIVSINGRYGNFNPDEAARVAAGVGATVAVPCHFWLLAEHNGAPGAFAEACRALAPGVAPVLIPLGGRYLHPAGRRPNRVRKRGTGAAGAAQPGAKAGAKAGAKSREAERA